MNLAKTLRFANDLLPLRQSLPAALDSLAAP